MTVLKKDGAGNYYVWRKVGRPGEGYYWFRGSHNVVGNGGDSLRVCLGIVHLPAEFAGKRVAFKVEVLDEPEKEE